MKFREEVSLYLKEAYSLSENTIKGFGIPKGFQRTGSILILRSNHKLDERIGEACLNIYSWTTGVFQHVSTQTEGRIPKLIYLAGQRNTETIHIENGVKYVLDIEKITFSQGNSNLRKRLINEVNDGENLLDMFAAVGNLSLQPILYKTINFHLIEKQPYTYKFLLKTLKINDVTRGITQNIDCRDITIKNWADRIFMGYHDVNEEHLTSALKALKQNGIIHLHPLVKNHDVSEWIEYYSKIIEANNYSIIDVTSYTVKKFSPGLEHTEIQFKVSSIKA